MPWSEAQMETCASLASAGRVLEACLLRFFNAAKLEDAARIRVRRDCRIQSTESDKTLEWPFFRDRFTRLVHFFNRAKLLYWHLTSHLPSGTVQRCCICLVLQANGPFLESVKRCRRRDSHRRAINILDLGLDRFKICRFTNSRLYIEVQVAGWRSITDGRI